MIKHMKKSTQKRRNGIAVISMLLLSVACVKQKRDFFVGMSDGLQDVKVGDGFYFIKSFGLSSSATEINGVNYWALQNDEKSYFKLNGFLRKLNDSIMLIPFEYNGREQKLFDFSTKTGASWKITTKYSKLYNSGDLVILSDVKKDAGDTTYLYTLKPFILYKKNQKEEQYGPIFNVEISRRNGIISISKLKAGRPGFDYKLLLYPRQHFIKDKNIMMDL